jgi:hypothetical protein
MLGHYTLSQVIATERQAWASTTGSRADFFFDGIIFWRLTLTRRRVADPKELPLEGWWHKTTCNCPLCLSRDI